MRLRSFRLGAALVAVVGIAGVVSACGGGSSGSGGSTATTGTSAEQARLPRGASVNYGSPPPGIAPAVKKAAAAAGCTVTGLRAEPAQIQPDGTYHVLYEPTYHVSLPPASGLHYPVWADYGVYDQPVPFRFQVHDLEHGAIIVHLGSGVQNGKARQQVVAMWRENPAYMLVVPEVFKQFPANALVVTSWQRWMVCKPYSPKDVAAVRTYANVYRGTGPEAIPGTDAGQGVAGLPKPAIPDPGASASG